MSTRKWYHSVGGAEAGPKLALGGEERLETTAADLVGHAGADVDDLDDLIVAALTYRRWKTDRVACLPSPSQGGGVGVGALSRSVRARSVIVPPAGMASAALMIRLTSASRSSLGLPSSGGTSSTSTTISIIAPFARAVGVDPLLLDDLPLREAEIGHGGRAPHTSDRATTGAHPR